MALRARVGHAPAMLRRVGALALLFAGLGCTKTREADAPPPAEEAGEAEPAKPAPIHPPPPDGEGFSRPEPRRVAYTPPPGVEACVYRLDETTTSLLDGEPHRKLELAVEYALEQTAPGRIRALVFHVEAKAREKNYEADLDSARPGDLRRVRGGADTLISPRMVEAFALLGAPIDLRLDGRRVAGVEGGAELRAAFLAMHPPGARAEAPYAARAEARLSDARIARWLDPLGTARLPSSPGELPVVEADFRQLGLRATGKTKARLRRVDGREIYDERSAFTPAGRDPDRPPIPGPELARLAGTRARTIARVPGATCFERAAETTSIRADWTDGRDEIPEIRPFDRTRTRIWTRETSVDP